MSRVKWAIGFSALIFIVGAPMLGMINPVVAQDNSGQPGDHNITLTVGNVQRFFYCISQPVTILIHRCPWY